MTSKIKSKKSRGASRDIQAIKSAIYKVDDIFKYLLDEQNSNIPVPDNIKFRFKSTNKNQYHLLQPIIGNISKDELKRTFINNGFSIKGNVNDIKHTFIITNKDRLNIGVRWTTIKSSVKSRSSINTLISETLTLSAIMNKCIENSHSNRNIMLNDLLKILSCSTNKINTYIKSAIKSAKSFYEHIKINPGDYVGERQLGDMSLQIYKKAKELSGKNKDNWNPADIWLFKKTVDMSDIAITLNKCNSINDLNRFIYQSMKSYGIIPISLKQILALDEARFDTIDEEYVRTLNLSELFISGVHLGYTKGTDIFGSIEFRLSNGCTIHGHARASSSSDIMYYQLVPKEGGTNSGIDKSLVNKYVYNGIKITNLQRLLLDNKDEHNIQLVNKLIRNIFNIAKENNIRIDSSISDMNKMYIEADKRVLPRFVMVLYNLLEMVNSCNNIIKNEGITVTQKMYLSGLKADLSSGQCYHFKIH